MNPEKIFDVYSENYDEKFNSNPVAIYQRQCVHETLEPLLNKATTLLDVGCGPGSDFEFYMNFEIKITAIDISPKMVQQAKNKADSFQLNAEIVYSSLESFESENKFDIILLNFGVINVFKDLEETLNILDKLLELNGKLIIVSMPSFHIFSILENAFRLQMQKLYHRIILNKTKLNNGFEFYYYSKKDLKNKFKIKKEINLCPILPSPDQFLHYKFLRLYYKIFWKIDRLISGYLPVFLGGDHIIFELEKK